MRGCAFSLDGFRREASPHNHFLILPFSPLPTVVFYSFPPFHFCRIGGRVIYPQTDFTAFDLMADSLRGSKEAGGESKDDFVCDKCDEEERRLILKQVEHKGDLHGLLSRPAQQKEERTANMHLVVVFLTNDFLAKEAAKEKRQKDIRYLVEVVKNRGARARETASRARYKCKSSPRLLYADGSIYRGETVDGERNGLGIYQYASGTKYEGSFKMGASDGLGVTTFADGNVYQGEFVNDKKHGYGMFIWAFDKSEYHGEWANGKRHGLGRMTFANGDVYAGSWVDGKMHGAARFMHADGRVFDGEFRDNEMVL